MVQVGIATRPEYERLSEPLAERGLEAVHVPTEGRATMLTEGIDDEVDVGFVYPQRIAEGGVADALLDVPWVNDRESLLRSRHKAETIARVAKAGLPTPRTALLSNPFDRSTLPAVYERFDPPVVVKPNYATRGEGIAKVDDYDSLCGVVDYIDLLHQNPAVGDRSYLLQEFLADARDYRAMVIDYECVGGVERRFPRESASEAAAAPLGLDVTPDSGASASLGRWKRNVHRGAVAEGVDLAPDLRRLAERVAEALEIPWLGVDLLVTDDRAVVNETNARPTVDDEAKYDDGFYDDLAALIRSRAE